MTISIYMWVIYHNQSIIQSRSIYPKGKHYHELYIYVVIDRIYVICKNRVLKISFLSNLTFQRTATTINKLM